MGGCASKEDASTNETGKSNGNANESSNQGMTQSQGKSTGKSGNMPDKIICDTSKICLTYFDFNARAALIRCMLTTSCCAFENKCIKMEEWGTMEKPTDIFEYGQMPVLQVDGKCFSQSVAIELMVGMELGYCGKTDEECYEVNNILCSKEDIFKIINPIMAFFMPNYEENLEENIKTCCQKLPKFLQVYCNKVKNKRCKYLAGDCITIADMWFAQVYTVLTHPCRKDHFAECLETHAAEFCAYAEGLCKNELKKFFCDNVEGGWIDQPL